MAAELYTAGICASIAVYACAAAVRSIVPRFSPVRALVLGLGTFRPRFMPGQFASHRVDDVRALRRAIQASSADQCMIVSGPKGVGKSRIIHSALAGHASLGVVHVPVQPSATGSQIRADTLEAITRDRFSWVSETDGARSVMWWHRLVFRAPVTVVLQAAARSQHTEPYAPVNRVARELTDEFGVRVIIDAGQNSLPHSTDASRREFVLEVESVPRALVEQVPELESLHKALKEADLADVVWACVGGNLDDYMRLLGAWQHRSCEDIELVAAAFVQRLLGNALDNVNQEVCLDEQTRSVLADIHLHGEMTLSAFRRMEFARPLPYKVLRVARRRTPAGSQGSGQFVIVPADAATSFVLRHAIGGTPSMEKLKAMLRPVK